MIVTLKDEIESLIRKGKLVKYKRYDEWQKWAEEGGGAHSYSPWQNDMAHYMNLGEQQILGTVEMILGAL